MGARLFSVIYYFFYDKACRILVPGPGIEPVPHVAKALSPNHWTTGKLPVV